MAEIIYRPGILGDSQKIAETRMQMLTENRNPLPSREELSALLISNQEYYAAGLSDDSIVVWLACIDEKVVGTGSVNFTVNPPNIHCPSGKTAYIANIYTLPEMRGRGIATEIFRLCVESAKARGCERLTLHALAAGRSIYEKCGFRTSQNAMAYYIND